MTVGDLWAQESDATEGCEASARGRCGRRFEAETMRVRTGSKIKGRVVRDRVVVDAASIASCVCVILEGVSE